MIEFPKERDELVDTGQRRYPTKGETYYWLDQKSTFGEGVHGPFRCKQEAEPLSDNDIDTLMWSYPADAYAIYVEHSLAMLAKRLREFEADLQQAILYNDGTVSWESAGHMRNRLKGRMERWAMRIADEAKLLETMAKGVSA